MELQNMKSCDNCDKQKVCKFMDNRREIEDIISRSVIPRGIIETPVWVTISCQQFSSSIKTR